MHIPDGYLSPSTCATLYGASAPFWYLSYRRMRRMAGTRTIPLISVFAAFSFVIMMFNLPLPGGTTGHATGVGIATIVLGPAGAIAAISLALTIQALFFGDGGLTALGANCFNMAVVGSFTAYFLYRVIGAGSDLRSGRRALAAAVAGYGAINASALCAALEFGVQPLWFHDSSGVPLYCPYPLAVAIPAMMIGHLTLAGLAELTISAGVTRYLQTADPGMLTTTAPGIAVPRLSQPVRIENFGVPRAYWIALGLLLLLSPLGIVAAGSAWGEWSPRELATLLPRGQAPHGMETLASLWDAPLARYAPSFVGNMFLGYLFSALVGTGIVVLLCVFLNAVFSRLPKRRTARRGFVERTVNSLYRVFEESLFAEQSAAMAGLLQRVDARAKLPAILLFLAAAASARRLAPLGLLFLIGTSLALLSRIPLSRLATRSWLPALAFSGVIALPALFLTPGPPIARVPFCGWLVTSSGVATASMLLARVLTAATLSALLVLTTEWNRILRALRFCRLPVAVVVLLGMTYRYLFVLLKTAQEMFESRRVRLVGVLEEDQRRRLASASVGILLEKSVALSQEIHLAMRARGFRGEVYLLAQSRLPAQGWAQLGACACLATALILWGR